VCTLVDGVNKAYRVPIFFMLGDLTMARLSFLVAVSACLLVRQSVSLQVTPNSPCASICIDDPNQDVSDPETSSTQGNDIVCSDSSYSTSPVGKKFESCVSCLQNSGASASGETDQDWFICEF